MKKSDKQEYKICKRIENGKINTFNYRFFKKDFKEDLCKGKKGIKVNKVLKKLEEDRVIFNLGYDLYAFDSLAVHYAKRVTLKLSR